VATNHRLHLGISSLADLGMPDDPSLVDQMQGRPVLSAIPVPGGKVVIQGDRIGNPEDVTGCLHPGQRLFPIELGCVDSDDHETLGPISLMPIHQLGDRVPTVDSPVRPKLQEDHLTPKIGKAERPGIDPHLIGKLRGRLADHGGPCHPRQGQGTHSQEGEEDPGREASFPSHVSLHQPEQPCRLSHVQIPAFSTLGLLDAGQTGKDASYWDKR